MTKRKMFHGKEKYPAPPNMKKRTKKMVCPTCSNKLSTGGKYKGCSRCGWTNKPKPLEAQERRHRAEKLAREARKDPPPPLTKEEIAFRKRRAAEIKEKRLGHFLNWLKRFKDSKKKHTRAEA